MAESSRNLDNILRHWAEGKVQKSLEQVREAGRRKIKPFLLENDPEKILEQYQSAVAGETKLNQAQNCSW